MPYKDKNSVARKESLQRYWIKNKESINAKRELNKEQNIEWKRTSHLKRYGLTKEMFEELVLSQNGRCAICDTVPIKISKAMEFRNTLYVDHNHDTGQIRGLLCQKCNVKLTAIENKEFMNLAIEYLKKYENDTR
jgi:hypothetical protein